MVQGICRSRTHGWLPCKCLHRPAPSFAPTGTPGAPVCVPGHWHLCHRPCRGQWRFRSVPLVTITPRARRTDPFVFFPPALPQVASLPVWLGGGSSASETPRRMALSASFKNGKRPLAFSSISIWHIFGEWRVERLSVCVELTLLPLMIGTTPAPGTCQNG